MKILKNLQKKSENKENRFENMSDEEKIELLAVMCLFCTAHAFKGILIKRFRAEYVPQNGDDVKIAKELFNSKGLELKPGRAWFNGVDNHPMLCSRYFLRPNAKSAKIVSFMRKIGKESQEIVKSANREKWWALQDTLSGIRQDFDQRVN